MASTHGSSNAWAKAVVVLLGLAVAAVATAWPWMLGTFLATKRGWSPDNASWQAAGWVPEGIYLVAVGTVLVSLKSRGMAQRRTAIVCWAVAALGAGLLVTQVAIGAAPASAPPVTAADRVSATQADTRPTRGPSSPLASETPATRARLAAVGADRTQRSSVSALSVLDALTVKGRAPKTTYSRDQFGQAWSDDNDAPGGYNGCDTRNDILRRDLAGDVLKPGTGECVLLFGALRDPYTANTISFHRGGGSTAVQIDHVVALSNAWQTGAQKLTDRQRVDLANDPLELLAVDGPTNDQKGDGDAATWLPPNKAYRCAYVARQLAVKQAYHLWLTPPEYAAIGGVLDACPNQTIPRETNAPNIVIEHRPHQTTAPTTSSPPVEPDPVTTSDAKPQSCTTTSSGSCIRGGQFCPQDSYGQTGYDAQGRSYVCKGDETHPHWELP